MKVSQWLREWQLTGKVPDGQDPTFAFWAGWILGTPSEIARNFDERREMAIKACEFIEEHAK